MDVGRLVKSTSRRNFVLLPLVLISVEALLQGGVPEINQVGLVLLPWGYLQYRFSGQYRKRLGGGGPGMAVAPERMVTTGIFAITRNPMYLGHLIFIAGLAITLKSWIALVIFLAYIPWFQQRVVRDENRLHELFGTEYEDYRRRVNRWLPFIL